MTKKHIPLLFLLGMLTVLLVLTNTRLQNKKKHMFSFLDLKIANAQRCTESDVKLLILMTSATGNYERRTTIRETWASNEDGVKVMFVVGEADDPVTQDRILFENDLYNDMIQGNFLDTYRNLTLKTVLALKYATEVCPQAQYILKADDDVFLNVPQLRAFVKNDLIPLKQNNFLMCSILNNTQPFRSGKYTATIEEYPEDYYPVYCAGWVVLMSSDLAHKLYEKVHLARFFHIEDVFTYGLAGSMIQGKRWVNVGPYTLSWDQINQIKSGSTKYDFLIGIYSMGDKDMRELWAGMKNWTVKEHLPVHFTR